MKALLALPLFIFATQGASATESGDLATKALAKAEGICESWFDKVSIQSISDGFYLQYTREKDDGSSELCAGVYRNNGTLNTLDCTLKSASNTTAKIKRYFDNTGKWIKTEGQHNTPLLSKKEPLLKLDRALLKTL